MRRIILLAYGMALVGVLPIGCRTRQEPTGRETTAMDTYLSVTIYDHDHEEGFLNAMMDSAFAEISRIEDITTDYSDVSEIGLANQNAGRDTVQVSGETRALIAESIHYSDLSGGSFDISIGPLVRLWDFLSETPRVPSSSSIADALSLVDYHLIAIGDGGIYLPGKGMRLDLGGIAKGYAVDRAVALLKRRGIRNVIVDLGGNLGVYWEGTSLLDSTRATIYVRHPRRSGEYFGHFAVGTCGIATSGDYQRFFISDGTRYHHLLDPHTGQPARGAVSVTVVADNATMADALSTAVFVLGSKKGMELIEHLQGVEGIIITEEDGELQYDVSNGLKGRFVQDTHD